MGPSPLAISAMVNADKAGKGAVIAFLHLRREAAGGQLVRLEVIADTITALALSGAGLIGAVAACLDGLNIAFHL